MGAVRDALLALESLVEAAREHGDPGRAREYCDRAVELIDDQEAEGEPGFAEKRERFRERRRELDDDPE